LRNSGLVIVAISDRHAGRVESGHRHRKEDACPVCEGSAVQRELVQDRVSTARIVVSFSWRVLAVLIFYHLAAEYGGPVAVAILLVLFVTVVLVALLGSDFYSERAMRILHCRPKSKDISPPQQRPHDPPRGSGTWPPVPPVRRTSRASGTLGAGEADQPNDSRQHRPRSTSPPQKASSVTRAVSPRSRSRPKSLAP
jgi:hypothetical protein